MNESGRSVKFDSFTGNIDSILPKLAPDVNVDFINYCSKIWPRTSTLVLVVQLINSYSKKLTFNNKMSV